MTDMLREWSAQADSALVYAKGIDTTIIPAMSWPVVFPAVRPSKLESDSLQTTLRCVSQEGDVRIASRFSVWRGDWTHRRPPSAENPLDYVGFVLSRETTTSDKVRWYAEEIIIVQGLAGDTVRVGGSVEMALSAPSYAHIRCQRYFLSIHQSFVQREHSLLSGPVLGEGDGIAGSTADCLEFDSNSVTTRREWLCRGRVLPGLHAEMTSKFEDITITDTVSFAP
jgi:hypothetical protein